MRKGKGKAAEARCDMKNRKMKKNKKERKRVKETEKRKSMTMTYQTEHPTPCHRHPHANCLGCPPRSKYILSSGTTASVAFPFACHVPSLVRGKACAWMSAPQPVERRKLGRAR